MAASPEDLSLCAVCIQNLVEPRRLPCGHVFCTSCLQDEIHQHTQTDGIYGFPCPSCGKTAKVTEPNINQSEWAKTFPLISKTSHPFSVKSRSKDIFSDGTSVCRVHKNFVKNAFCSDCDIVICSKCVSEDHPHCRQVLSLQNAVDVVEKNLQSYLEEIKREEENINLFYPDLLPSLKTAAENLDADVSSAREMITRSAKQLVQTVQKQEHELLDELERKHKTERRKLQRSSAAVLGLSVVSMEIRSIQTSEKDVKFLHSAESVASDLLKAQKDASKLDDVVRAKVRFVPDEHSLLTFRLGKIEITRDKNVYS